MVRERSSVQSRSLAPVLEKVKLKTPNRGRLAEPPIDFVLMNPCRSARAGAPRGWPRRGSKSIAILYLHLPNKKNFCYNVIEYNLSEVVFFDGRPSQFEATRVVLN